jgi:hypothetical protein
MAQFQFRCRATEIQHSCAYEKETEPVHPSELLGCVANAIKAIEMMQFTGTIASAANSYQINTDFDTAWIAGMAKVADWQIAPLPAFGELGEIPSIQPDGLLTKHGVAVAIEVEKSNKKTIWFDIIKILMLVEQHIADFGILLVPRNYAHKLGEWDLFREARFYRWCLLRFARVNPGLLSKLAIIGYTQEAHIAGSWMRLNSAALTDIKRQAREYFLTHPSA